MSVIELQDFAGSWHLSRVITDTQTGALSRLEGEAVFSPMGDGLEYFETGQLQLPDGPPVRAERRYQWTQQKRLIAITFADGRYFHDFDPALPHPEAEHICTPDQYVVRYDLTDWPNWKAQWRVIGPRKDYSMVSRYRRQSDSDRD